MVYLSSSHTSSQNKGEDLSLQVCAALSVDIMVFWLVTPCSVGRQFQRSEKLAASILRVEAHLKTTPCHNPENYNLKSKDLREELQIEF
jgi:hypothetical protein